MDWVQIYDPLGAAWLSTLMAAAPIVVLLGLLVIGQPAPRAAVVGLAVALAVAIGGFGMPAGAAWAAAAYGACFGLLPIGWIVLAAVFLFHLTVRSGQFEVVKRSVAAISPDRRMQALLIAFSFGTFVEGAAGFGTPVAISAALLIGLGFSPLYAAGLALLANTSPVAFGALGTPIITLAEISGLDEMALSQMAGRQLPFFSLIVPAWLVATMSGWRGVVGCWPAILVCGGSFAGIQFVTANFHGPSWSTWSAAWARWSRSPCSCDSGSRRTFGDFPTSRPKPRLPTRRRLRPARSCMPGCPGCCCRFWFSCGARNRFARCSTAARRASPTCWPVSVASRGKCPGSTAASIAQRRWCRCPRAPTGPLSPRKPSTISTGSRRPAPESSWPRCCRHSGCGSRRRPSRCSFVDTLWKMRWALLTIACMLALAFTTKYSGGDATLGLAFTKTGWLYPFFAPLLGWLGVALTGSDTSSNALFGSLQRITAEQLGLNPMLIVASNSTGGVMGKMIDAQSIVVAAVATQQTGGEGRILRFVFLHSLALAALVGLLTLLQAYVFPWMIPTPGG